jgi:deoxyribodipyrimidine photo-lyase
MKPLIHIVWFKHDLRAQDHTALYEACKHGAVLPIFCWDNSVWGGNDYATQHQAFVEECLVSLKRHLQSIGLSIIEFRSGIIETLNHITQYYSIGSLYSHEETGNNNSYQLDKLVTSWCSENRIKWLEYPQNGVVRRLKSRDTWAKKWESRMTVQQTPLPHDATMAVLVDGLRLGGTLNVLHDQTDKPLRQRGGREEATKLLHTFLNGRASRYRGGISSPLSSECAGSRLSPYLTWGVLSMREVVQSLRKQNLNIQANPSIYPKNLLAGLVGFESRLHWHCHFMQKLESEPTIEFQNLHPMFDCLRDEHYSGDVLQTRLDAWKTGQTGWPIVDACMAMLRETGWINFRMRAMLMSTASYLLWLHWRETGLHLAREFLDYEPGIHWSQVQMQSGTTGINTLRIYNPVKQAQDQDPEGVFVRRWLPALRPVPNTWIFQPWLMPESLQAEYGCRIGVDYPAPLVNINQALKSARAAFSQLKQNSQHHAQTAHIIKKHASRKSSLPRQSTRNKSALLEKKLANALAERQQTLF